MIPVRTNSKTKAGEYRKQWPTPNLVEQVEHGGSTGRLGASSP
jgi:hypothetical protein